jgi:carboxylesterase
MTVAETTRPLLFEGSSDLGILIIHGITSTPASVAEWAEALHRSTGATVALPLLPGHGTTWQDLNTVSWHDWEDTVIDAFDALAARCRKVAVGGLSLGGALSVLVATQRPQVDALILINHLMWLDNPLIPFSGLIKLFVPAVKPIGSSINQPGVTEIAYDMTPTGAVHQMHLLMRHLRPQLPDVKVPTLMFKSRVDHVVPTVSATRTMQRLGSPHKELVWLEKSDHVATQDYDLPIIIEKSQAFLKEVLS